MVVAIPGLTHLNRIFSSTMSDKKEYTELKNQLIKEITKKQELTEKLNDLEDLIYDKESEYFNESQYGTIVKGFENFSKNTNANKKKIVYTDEDHIFSLSSTQYIKNLMRRQGEPVKEDYDDYEDTVEVNEPESPGTPRKRRDK